MRLTVTYGIYLISECLKLLCSEFEVLKREKMKTRTRNGSYRLRFQQTEHFQPFLKLIVNVVLEQRHVSLGQ